MISMNEVMEAIAAIARKHRTYQVKIIKNVVAFSLVKEICSVLGLDEWEYGNEVWQMLVKIAEITGLDHIGEIYKDDWYDDKVRGLINKNYKPSDYYKVDPISLESIASLEADAEYYERLQEQEFYECYEKHIQGVFGKGVRV